MKENIEIYEEERPWGKFRRFTDNTSSTVKIITVKAGEELSLQSHKQRSEFWRVISGSGIFEVDNKKVDCNAGDEILIPVGAKHRIIASSEEIEILEISMGYFDEGDIVRYEDKYGRV